MRTTRKRMLINWVISPGLLGLNVVFTALLVDIDWWKALIVAFWCCVVSDYLDWVFERRPLEGPDRWAP